MDFVFGVSLFLVRLVCWASFFVIMLFGITLVLSVPTEYNNWIHFAKATVFVVIGSATIILSFIGINAIPVHKKAT